MADWQGEDRREHPRFNEDFQLSYKVDGKEKKAVTENVSLGGFSFRCDDPFSIGSVCDFALSHDDISDGPLVVRAMIVHVQSRKIEANVLMGVRIMERRPGQEKAVKAFEDYLEQKAQKKS